MTGLAALIGVAVVIIWLAWPRKFEGAPTLYIAADQDPEAFDVAEFAQALLDGVEVHRG